MSGINLNIPQSRVDSMHQSRVDSMHQSRMDNMPQPRMENIKQTFGQIPSQIQQQAVAAVAASAQPNPLEGEGLNKTTIALVVVVIIAIIIIGWLFFKKGEEKIPENDTAKPAQAPLQLESAEQARQHQLFLQQQAQYQQQQAQLHQAQLQQQQLQQQIYHQQQMQKQSQPAQTHPTHTPVIQELQPTNNTSLSAGNTSSPPDNIDPTKMPRHSINEKAEIPASTPNVDKAMSPNELIDNL